MNRIEIHNYSKQIKKQIVLDDVSFSFEEGKLYGLYGRNGSGKTMLLRAIAGLIYPDNGSVVIEGKVLHKDISFPDSIGIIIENTNLLPQYTGYENLKILSKIKKIASDEDIKASLIKVGLSPEDSRKVKAYSLGMKQKLSIAQAIFEKPRLLLLDEPTNALDAKGVENLKQILLDEKKRGTTILVASHDKEDLNIMADQIITVSEGKLSVD